MKYTKIITSLLLAGAFLCSSPLMAADNDKADKKARAGQKGKAGRKNPLAELGLSKEQMKQVAALRKEVGAKMKKAREDKNREAMQAAQKEMREGLAKILNEEQLEKYQKIMAEMRKGGKGKGKGGKGKGKGKGKKKES